MLRLILANKLPDGLVIPQGNVFYGMTGDKPVLTDHNRQMHIPVLRNAVCLQEIVICLLIVLCIDLNPAGIPCPHAIGMLRIDI